MNENFWLERFSRQITLDYIGIDGQKKLNESTSLIVGVGGLGSFSAMGLTRMGVKRIILIDRDIVSYSDLHRQVLYDEKDIGLPKVEAARKKLKAINTDTVTEVYGSSVNNVPLLEKLIKKSDVIIDGLDNMGSRYTVNRLAVKYGKPYIFAAAIGLYGNISTIIPGKTPCLEEFYGNLNDSELPKCATSGVHPSIVYMISSLSIHEAISVLIGKTPSLASKLALIDLRSLSLQLVNLTMNQNCNVCRLKESPKPSEDLVELSCSKDGMATLFVNKGAKFDLNLSTSKLKENGFVIVDSRKYYISFKKDSFMGTIFNTGYMVFQSKHYYEGVETEALRAHDIAVGK